MRPEVEKVLMSLTKTERQEAVTYLSYRSTRPSQQTVTYNEQQVWNSMQVVLRSKGIRMPRQEEFVANYGRENFAQGALDFEAAVTQGTRSATQRLTNVERQAMMDLLIACLIDYLGTSFPPIAATPTALLDNSAKIIPALDRAFPGYVAGGTLGIVVSRQMHRTSNT